MIRHIVLFEFQSTVTDEDIEALIAVPMLV